MFNAMVINVHILNRVAEFGASMANRFLDTMLKIEGVPPLVSLKDMLLVSETTMDIIWNYLVKSDVRSFNIDVHPDSPPRHVKKIIDRVIQHRNPEMLHIDFDRFADTSNGETFLFNLLVAGVKSGQLDHECIINNYFSDSLVKINVAHQVVSAQLTHRVGKDLTWLIFQYLVG